MMSCHGEASKIRCRKEMANQNFGFGVKAQNRRFHDLDWAGLVRLETRHCPNKYIPPLIGVVLGTH